MSFQKIKTHDEVCVQSAFKWFKNVSSNREDEAGVEAHLDVKKQH
jgi:hypothetical protein